MCCTSASVLCCRVGAGGGLLSGSDQNLLRLSRGRLNLLLLVVVGRCCTRGVPTLKRPVGGTGAGAGMGTGAGIGTCSSSQQHMVRYRTPAVKGTTRQRRWQAS